MKIISLNVDGASIALEYNPTYLDMIFRLISSGLLVERYCDTSSGDYSKVFVKAEPVVRIIENGNVFAGTIEEYRAQPKTNADLVADLSAANDALDKAQAEITRLKMQRYDAVEREAAE